MSSQSRLTNAVGEPPEVTSSPTLVRPLGKLAREKYQASPGAKGKGPLRRTKQTNRLLKSHPSMGLRYYGGLSEDQMLRWSVRRVLHVYFTVEFEPPIQPSAGPSTTHDCLYCSCRCRDMMTDGGTGREDSTRCDHCQYYQESHPARCIGEFREKSGSIAYILRHGLLKEMPMSSTEDKNALDFLRLSPLDFNLIEKVRQRYHAYPLGNELRIDRIPSADLFIRSTELNGYEGYRLMLTNANSQFEPMSRGDWHRWYRAQVRLLTRPPEPVGCKAPLSRRPDSSGVRYLHYVVVETDATTGSKYHTASPRIPVEEQARYIRLELTSLPLADASKSKGTRRLGVPRSNRCVTSDNVNIDLGHLREDVEARGYPIATLSSAPLKQFEARQRRELHYTIEDDKEYYISEAIPLAGDDRYLKIFLTAD